MLVLLLVLAATPTDVTIALPDNSKATKYLRVIVRDDLTITRFWYQRDRLVYEGGKYVKKCCFIVEAINTKGKIHYIQCQYNNNFDIKKFAGNLDDKPIKEFTGRYP